MSFGNNRKERDPLLDQLSGVHRQRDEWHNEASEWSKELRHTSRGVTDMLRMIIEWFLGDW